jgi:hypothetical protein
MATGSLHTTLRLEGLKPTRHVVSPAIEPAAKEPTRRQAMDRSAVRGFTMWKVGKMTLSAKRLRVFIIASHNQTLPLQPNSKTGPVTTAG